MCGLHVHSGVADVEGVGGGNAGGGKDVVYDGGVGFDGNVLPLSQNNGKQAVVEEMAYQFHGALMVFVGGNRQAYAFGAEGMQQIGDSGVGAGEVGFMRPVVFDKFSAQAVDVFRLAGIFRQGAFHQFGDAAAYKKAVSVQGMGGVAVPGEGVVGACRQVVDGVQQGAV